VGLCNIAKVCALLEDFSLLVVPPHKNLYLIEAIAASFIAHFKIIYILTCSPLLFCSF